MTREELAIKHAEARGWNAAIAAAAAMLENSAFYFVGVEPTKLVPSKTGEPATILCAREVRKLDKSVQAIDD